MFSVCDEYDRRAREAVAFSFEPELPNKMQPGLRWGGPTARRVQALVATSHSATGDRADVDLAVVARVLAGETRAFEEIVRRWQGPLVNMAWRYCRDRSRAEELAQEAFIRAWRGLAQWRRESSFSTWLFALAANVFRTELKRFPAVNLPIEGIAEPSAPAGQHRELEERGRDETVRRAVLALPMRYREPVILFYFHEMDVAAAARTLGMPEGTLKARLKRARALLAQRFPHLRDKTAAAKLEGKEA
jgi:RNA polymerase sigma-70 factor, ECF subfamily